MKATEKPLAAGATASVQAAFSWNALISTYLPALVLALGTGIALPAIPTLAQSFGVSFGVASGVVTSFLIGNLAGTLPSGWLIDRFGRRPVMIAGPLLTSAMAFLVVFADSFPQLLVLRFFDGCAAQMWLMARLAAISHGAPAEQRGRQVSWMFGMNNAGKLAGPMLGGFIAFALGMRAPFVAYAVLALIALVPTFMFAEDTPRREGSAREKAPALNLALLRQILRPRLVYFAVALFAGLTRGPLYADLLHLYAAFAYHLDAQQIGYLATAATLIGLPIGFTAGWMMDHFGRKRTMVPGFAGVALAMVALAVSAFAGLSYAWYVALFFLAVALQSLTGGSVQTVGADVAPAEGRGMFLGVWRLTGQLGTTFSPVIFAILADALNFGSSFLFVAASAAVVASLLIFYVPETRTAK
ncbi:MAG TPA: MFS transporter [Xanthobacteraceae bacterium]|nr:MFS transporter [Xanthobacteraceae bacterium]